MPHALHPRASRPRRHGVAIALVFPLLLTILTPLAARAQPIGSDLAELNLCLSADCEARGSWAADPWGWANPATMPVGPLAVLPHGGLASPAYFHGNAGGIAADIGVPVAALFWDPAVFEVDGLYAELGGTPKSLPGVEIHSRFRQVRAAAAVDLGRTRLGLTGLSLGLRVAAPGTTTDSRLLVGGRLVLREQDQRDYDLTFGVHWRTGAENWLSVGGVAETVRDTVRKEGIAPDGSTATIVHGANDAWFTRAGLSVLPLVPAGLDPAISPLAELGRQVRFGADLEYRNIVIDGEPTRDRSVGYFGLDVPLLARRWQPIADYLQVWSIAGVDTDTGWGIGFGLVGNGPIQFLACNGAYSSRPFSPSLGDRVDIWGANCAIVF